jgi:hypothetical protein
MNRQQIKLLAIAAMTIDHITLVFVPSASILYYMMRLIGRMTAPLMAFMLAEGVRYTRSRSRYLLRLLAFALISQPFYFRMLFGRAPTSALEYVTHWNVMFSLAVALISLMLLESKISATPRLILVSVCISLAQFGDWSFMIPVWTVIFHVFRDDRRRCAALFTIVSVVLQTTIWLPQYDSFAAFSYQYGTLLALIPIMLYCYNRKRGNVLQKNLNRWFFYVYYPLHMTVLLLIKTLWNHT